MAAHPATVAAHPARPAFEDGTVAAAFTALDGLKGVVAGTLTAVLLHALFAVADRTLTTPGRPRSADRAPAPPEG